MAQEEAIKLFDEKQVRYVWDDEQEKYYFSVVDVIQVLTDSDRPRKYWSDLKRRLEEEGSELSAKIGQLKLQAADGKKSLILESKIGCKVLIDSDLPNSDIAT